MVLYPCLSLGPRKMASLLAYEGSHPCPEAWPLRFSFSRKWELSWSFFPSLASGGIILFTGVQTFQREKNLPFLFLVSQLPLKDSQLGLRSAKFLGTICPPWVGCLWGLVFWSNSGCCLLSVLLRASHSCSYLPQPPSALSPSSSLLPSLRSSPFWSVLTEVPVWWLFLTSLIFCSFVLSTWSIARGKAVFQAEAVCPANPACTQSLLPHYGGVQP